jgi:4-hydroxyacetophenone monooxygenase
LTLAEARTQIDPVELAAALAVANIPTLVPLLFQLTGDRRWLHEPYRPTRAKGMGDHDGGGLPEHVQLEIRAAANEAVLAWAAGQPASYPAPIGPQLVELMTVCVGEVVPAEYEPMAAEHMGFRAAPARRARPTVGTGFHVLVIGAGVSGLTASKNLQDAGIAHTVVEKNPRVGGTWIDNRYPGCGVDTPSYLYSLSFFPWAWSTHFGKRAELELYFDELASRFDLRSSIRFSTTALSAIWDDDTQLWSVVVRDADGQEQTLTANAVITAVGQLNVPKVPLLDGLEDFTGPVFHSARWPQDFDITGKRVAVIGTGASAMQIVPAIVDQAEAVTVYQRSPQWIAPNDNYFRAVGDDVHWLMDHVPYYRAWYRFRLAWLFNDRIHVALQKDPDWPFPARSLNAINDGHREFFTSYLTSQLEGRPDLIAKALPNYPPFGKRMLLDNGWFSALKQPHVELVTSSVTGLAPTGVVTAEGQERQADVVVLATGFEAHRPIHVDITGRDGQSLQDLWGDDDARAYLGITTPGFPNLFFMYGPNTNLGHGGSFIFLAESQIDYIVDALCTMVNEDISSVECRAEVNERYNRALDEAHERMVWTHNGMDTWYRNSKGRVVTNMPWRVVDYWAMTRAVDLDDFHVRKAR